MQQFKEELKNVPRDTSLVPCSTNLELNRDQSLSVLDGFKDNLEKESLKGKLTLNTPEVNPAQQTGRSLKAFVFALSSKGEVLKLRLKDGFCVGKLNNNCAFITKLNGEVFCANGDKKII